MDKAAEEFIESASTYSDEMWPSSAIDCDCGAPPEFYLPPPPRPPFLSDFFCNENIINQDFESCDTLPIIDASYRSGPLIQMTAILILSSLILVSITFVAIIIIWKHKRKMRNFLPCKKTNQSNCDGQTAAPTVIYEDLTEVLQRSNPNHNTGHIKHPSMEMINVKNIHYPSGYPMTMNPPIFLCSSPGPDPYCSQELYNPIYEELSDAETDLAHGSEDDFAEDELSLNGVETRQLQSLSGRSLHQRHQQQSHKQQLQHHCHCYTTSLPYRWNNKDNRYHQKPTNNNNINNSTSKRTHVVDTIPCVPTINTISNSRRPTYRNQNEFHEGILLDSLLHLYPHVGNDLNTTNNSNPSSTSPNTRSSFSKKLQSLTRNKKLKSSCLRAQVSQQQSSLPTITMVSNNDFIAAPCSNTIRKQQIYEHPYESVPVLEHLASSTFRPIPKPYSQDSAFGSDSGYSNNTNCCGMSMSTNTSTGTGTSTGCGMTSNRNRNRNRRDLNRLSQNSTDLS